MFKKILVNIENFYYKVLIKNLLKTSKLGYGFVVSGAESGINFEHIYDNKPKGKLLIGRIIDRALLNLKAVQSTRKRKDDIKEVLWNEIGNNGIKKRKTIILDLASGPSRYVRETMRGNQSSVEVESVCVDRDSGSLRLGKILSRSEGIKNIRFVKGNIFKLAKLRRFGFGKKKAPNVVIAAGLLIYFNEQKVKEILTEIFGLLPSEGLLIFTSYENLDTRKLMRKTMATSTGENWVLYYRKPEFWRELVHSIGYREFYVMRDQWQMNNVCFARK